MYRASAPPADERENTAGERPASLPSVASFSSAGGVVVSAQEKREALEEVLGSERFSRAEQLRNFLRYICEMELAGRGGELCEALIGVEALGRPADYTPAEDASVRRRASDLREKLQDVYAAELASSRIRIELPKGKYIPRFVRVEAESGGDGAETAAAKTAPAETLERKPSHQSPELVEAALSPVPARDMIAARIDSGAMEGARKEPGTAGRRRVVIFSVAVGWVLGALMVATGFTLALWLRPARTETASPQPATGLPASSAIAVEPGTSYEAESPNNSFHQAVKPYSCDWCSGGYRVRYIGMNPRNYLVINDINASRADNYEMVIFYVVDGTRTLFIRVNGGAEMKLLITGRSWREVAKVSVMVPLNAGSNKIKFYNASGHAPDIDRILIR
jgi:hypothetical protein